MLEAFPKNNRSDKFMNIAKNKRLEPVIYSVCMYVCVAYPEGEREREGERKRKRERESASSNLRKSRTFAPYVCLHR